MRQPTYAASSIPSGQSVYRRATRSKLTKFFRVIRRLKLDPHRALRAALKRAPPPIAIFPAPLTKLVGAIFPAFVGRERNGNHFYWIKSAHCYRGTGSLAEGCERMKFHLLFMLVSLPRV